MAKGRSGLIAALDIGTTKVCCLIADADGAGGFRVRGIGHQVSRGLRGGTIVDMVAAEASILAAVHAAEQMAGETIDRVIVNLPGTTARSHLVDIEVEIAGHAVDDADMRRIYAEGRRLCEDDDREIIHAIPVDHQIDDAHGIRDPRGMYGDRLGVSMHVVAASAAHVRNLVTCINRCHLEVDAIVAAPYASGLAALVEDETSMGVTVVDMGGATVTIAVFLEGSLIHVDAVPVGGMHITRDIAHGLSTPVNFAERLKTLYGSAIATPSDDRELIDVPQIGEADADSANHVPRSLLIGIIKPRIEETLELVRTRLEASGLADAGARRVVLTGGACQLQGLRELAGNILDKQVRLGKPLKANGLAEATGGPAFSTTAGLLVYAVQDRPEVKASDQQQREARGAIGRLGRWLRANF